MHRWRPVPARSRTWLLLVLTLALVPGLTVVGAPRASAATPSRVVSQPSGRCLDVARASRAPGAPVIVYDCHGQDNQAWSLTAAGELRVYGSGLCLDVVGQDTTSPAAVQTWTCNGQTNQRWRLASNGTITGVQSGLCLDVTGRRTDNGAPVGMWTCNGQTNQRWTTALATADTTPPTVPADPRVADLTCRSATFSWDAATDDTAVAFYDVYHDGQLMTTVPGSTRSTALTLVAGVSWGLYVNARDAAGNVSQASRTVPVTPPFCSTDTTAPSVPRSLTATTTGTTASLAWAASTDDVGVRAYEVYRDGTLVGTVTGTATTAPATRFLDSGLAARTTYGWAVLARDAQGNRSARSSTASATTGAACSNPVCGVRQVGTDTDIPWGLVTLPDGSILYSRRDAHDLVRLDPATGAMTAVGTVPGVSGTDGEGGLMGLALSPTFATDGWLYVMHTSAMDNRVVRFRLVGGRLDVASEQVLLSGILRNKFHDGGRLRFGPDGKLYVSTGDAQNGANAQDRAGLNGKVLRMGPDGRVPADNPFGTYVWSYGHRNPQGLAFDSSGRLWEQEFGDGIMDETNLVVKGGNYGWPACQGTVGTCGTPGFIAPEQTYPVAEGSCSGIAVVRDVLYVACERGARLYRASITGGSLTGLQTYLSGTYGRLRTVEPAPGGGLWLTTSNLGDEDSTADNSDEKILQVSLGS